MVEDLNCCNKMKTVRNVCLKKNYEGFVYVIFDTTNHQNIAMHDELHI